MQENGNTTRYVIDIDEASDHRSLSMVVAQRKCYECKQADTPESVVDSDTQEHIQRIMEHCKDTSDYLLPDTPLKEAIFKVMLAEGNAAMTAEEVSKELSTRWTMTTYPRDVSPRVIGRLLEHSQGYSIAAVPEPEAEIEEVEAPEDSEAEESTPLEAVPQEETQAPDQP